MIYDCMMERMIPKRGRKQGGLGNPKTMYYKETWLYDRRDGFNIIFNDKNRSEITFLLWRQMLHTVTMHSIPSQLLVAIDRHGYSKLL